MGDVLYSDMMSRMEVGNPDKIRLDVHYYKVKTGDGDEVILSTVPLLCLTSAMKVKINTGGRSVTGSQVGGQDDMMPGSEPGIRE